MLFDNFLYYYKIEHTILKKCTFKISYRDYCLIFGKSYTCYDLFSNHYWILSIRTRLGLLLVYNCFLWVFFNIQSLILFNTDSNRDLFSLFTHWNHTKQQFYHLFYAPDILETARPILKKLPDLLDIDLNLTYSFDDVISVLAIRMC